MRSKRAEIWNGAAISDSKMALFGKEVFSHARAAFKTGGNLALGHSLIFKNGFVLQKGLSSWLSPTS
jgi:hypothetical protein